MQAERNMWSYKALSFQEIYAQSNKEWILQSLDITGYSLASQFFVIFIMIISGQVTYFFKNRENAVLKKEEAL